MASPSLIDNGQLAGQGLDQAEALVGYGTGMPLSLIAIRRRRVADARTADRPGDLAHAVHDLGAGLARVGRYEDALTALREAEGMYRQLAAEQPDV